MNERGKTKKEIPPALERPESGETRIVRVSARFFALAADEGLTPYEQAVAWQRIGRMILREAFWKLAMGSLLRTLALELVAELPRALEERPEGKRGEAE
jgi:hypothetical protein